MRATGALLCHSWLNTPNQCVAGPLKYIISTYFNGSLMHYSKALYIMNNHPYFHTISFSVSWEFQRGWDVKCGCNYPRVAVNTFIFLRICCEECWEQSRLGWPLAEPRVRCLYRCAEEGQKEVLPSLLSCQMPSPPPDPAPPLVPHWHSLCELQKYLLVLKKKKERQSFCFLILVIVQCTAISYFTLVDCVNFLWLGGVECMGW